ncbi:MAG TPA: DUF892 family protein [Sphingomonas sp.]|nr:DUF892 family protein [Sphingomonas sp.]
MTKTSSKAALLHICLQDLHAGKVLLVERLPALAEASRDPALATLLSTETARASDAMARLAEAGGDMAGPANLWMTGILDDADRDADSHEPGLLLDVALIGAVRKAKAAEIVSSETAIALAGAIGDIAIAAAVTADRDDEIATDRALADRLAALLA